MKMITKVFLVIAILLVCLICWALFLGDGGVLQNAWNGVADMVNSVWQSITGNTDATNIIMPDWKSDTDSLGEGMDNMDGDGSGGSPGSTTTGP